VKSSARRGRREMAEMTSEKDEDDGSEVAKISLSTGTTGGVQPSGGRDNPPDREMFKEDAEFDIKYQQNGRVTGGVDRTFVQPDAKGNWSQDRARPKTRGHRNRRPYRTQVRRSVGDRDRNRRKTERRNGAKMNRKRTINKMARDTDRRRQARRYVGTDYDEDEEDEEEDRDKKDEKEKKRVRDTDTERQTRRYIDEDEEDDEEEDRNEKNDVEDAKKNKRGRDTDRQRETRRHNEEDEEKQSRDETDEQEDDDELSEVNRYNEFVKKDINDYFAQSKSAADEEEVFDRSERAGKTPVGRGIPRVLTFLLFIFPTFLFVKNVEKQVEAQLGLSAV